MATESRDGNASTTQQVYAFTVFERCDVREDVEAQPVVHKLFDRFPYPAVSSGTYRSPCCGILIAMMPLILIGSLLLVVLGILIVLGVIPIFPEKKRERRPARKVAAPRD